MIASRRQATQADSWRESLSQVLPLFRHRNWIVVADAAYPAHSCSGIRTVLASAEHVDVVRVTDAIAAACHVSATVYPDAELDFVNDADVRGVSDRKNLEDLLAGLPRVPLPHEQIIARLDAAAARFRVLIIKRQMRTPYTSAFIELACGHWGAGAKRALRAAIETAGK